MVKFDESVSGQDFVELLTADRAATPQWYEWEQKRWVNGEGALENGGCNVNDHSQWNCVPKVGLHSHYATRNCLNNGGGRTPAVMYCGQCTNNEDWYTSFSAVGDDDRNLERFVLNGNWDGTTNKHGIRGDGHGTKRTSQWLYYK
jgi:hypothetical protein